MQHDRYSQGRMYKHVSEIRPYLASMAFRRFSLSGHVSFINQSRHHENRQPDQETLKDSAFALCWSGRANAGILLLGFLPVLVFLI